MKEQKTRLSVVRRRRTEKNTKQNLKTMIQGNQSRETLWNRTNWKRQQDTEEAPETLSISRRDKTRYKILIL